MFFGRRKGGDMDKFDVRTPELRAAWRTESGEFFFNIQLPSASCCFLPLPLISLTPYSVRVSACSSFLDLFQFSFLQLSSAFFSFLQLPSASFSFLKPLALWKGAWHPSWHIQASTSRFSFHYLQQPFFVMSEAFLALRTAHRSPLAQFIWHLSAETHVLLQHL